MKSSVQLSKSFTEKHFSEKEEVQEETKKPQNFEQKVEEKPQVLETPKPTIVQEPIEVKVEVYEAPKIEEKKIEKVEKPKIVEEKKAKVEEDLTEEELNELETLKHENLRLKFENQQLLYQQGRLTKNLEDARQEFIMSELEKLEEFIPKRNLKKVYPCQTQKFDLEKCYLSNPNNVLLCQDFANQFSACSKKTRSKLLNSFII